MKSQRNKTIDIGVEEGREYLERCIDCTGSGSKKKKPGPVINDPDLLTDKTVIGDCIEIMEALPGDLADLIIADPPYNMDKDFGDESFRRLSDNDYFAYTVQWISMARRILKQDGSIYVCCDWKSGPIIYQALGESFKIKNRITWQREKGRGANNNWKNCMEDIWFAVRSDEYTFNLDAVKVRRRVRAPYRVDGKPKDWEETDEGNFRNTHPSNFWDDISVPYWSMPENTLHPTQKPEKLLAKLILASSNPGDLVFDPFLGSGSTSVTAKKLGRHYLGIEKNPRFCVWAEKRLEMAEKDGSIQGYKDGIFWERNSGK
ncbi:MAG: site-specific DNA-methyltransferase [Lachnospiraceae bacterium]|nr:site-specific DNA-methyltransferase [Lachnospiraceae bacterium]